MRKSGITNPQNPETFIQSEVTIHESQLPNTAIYCKWNRVTLESKQRKWKSLSESVDRDTFYDKWLKEVPLRCTRKPWKPGTSKPVCLQEPYQKME